MTDELQPEEAALINMLMAKSGQANAYLATQLMEGYRNEAAQLRATIELIRMRIRDLYNQPFVPSQSSVIGALYPFPPDIEEYAENFK